MTYPAFAWALTNSVLSVMLSFILIHKLTAWYETFNQAERTGMGIMAGAVLCTIPLMWHNGDTPFDDWSTMLLRGGAVMYFLGRLSRLYKHWWANDRMRQDAEAHFQGRMHERVDQYGRDHKK